MTQTEEEDKYEALFTNWPLLFQKAQIGDHIEVGPGWYNILDVLCQQLSHGAESKMQQVLYYENQPNVDQKKLENARADLDRLIDELPTIVQIKEKFGGLRFYVDGGTTEHGNYIQFAEAMSGRTCDVCGGVGKLRTGGWLRVLCDSHFQA
jgi:hypothetical protein